MTRFIFPFLIAAMLFVAGCDRPEPSKTPVFEPASFELLKGWEEDQHVHALKAFQNSCARILKQPDMNYFGDQEWSGTYADWKPACHAAMTVFPVKKQEAKAFFERYFKPVRVTAGEDFDHGLFTGYYEASLRGTKEKKHDGQVPIHARPDDLVMVNLGQFREELKGTRIAGRVSKGYLQPYETRDRLVEDETIPVIAWANDPIDAFFMHIQGSGRIYLEDTMDEIRVGYDGQNGHPYLAIGRVLVHQDHMKREDVSMQSIEAWLRANPSLADSVMNQNGSYVFFRKQERDGAIGGENVVLTPERSLAVDHTLYPYGMPVWVDLEHPERSIRNIRQLMVAQDTGGAIRGVIRGDFFWGHGDDAEKLAGQMNSKGAMWLLLPKDVAQAL